VGGAGGGEEDDVGDVFGGEGGEAAVDLRRALAVAVEADEGEVGLDHPGVYGGDADVGAEEVDAQAPG
jgi:hypothetical protein